MRHLKVRSRSRIAGSQAALTPGQSLSRMCGIMTVLQSLCFRSSPLGCMFLACLASTKVLAKRYKAGRKVPLCVPRHPALSHRDTAIIRAQCLQGACTWQPCSWLSSTALRSRTSSALSGGSPTGRPPLGCMATCLLPWQPVLWRSPTYCSR